MKRMILILLLCTLLLSTTASAWSMEDALSERFTYSPWAEEALTKADDLNLITQGEGDLRYAITRAQFAQDASRLVALAYDRKPASIYAITKLRAGKAGADDIWLWLSQQLGILQGRENGDLDGEAYITRQEAAVILARTYRLYAGEGPELTQPLPYSDADEIASWAVEDVRRMTQLGILGGVENGAAADFLLDAPQDVLSLARRCGTAANAAQGGVRGGGEADAPEQNAAAPAPDTVQACNL